MFKKKLPATVFAFLLMSSVALAQAPPCPANDPTAVPVDTLSTTLSFASTNTSGTSDTADTTQVLDSSGTDTSVSYRTSGTATGDVIVEISIWRTQNGNVYSIQPGSIRFSGDDRAIDSMPTKMLFDLIAQAAVGQGHTAGYSTCPANCGNNFVRVSLPACVRRLGSGKATRFESCRPGACCTRTYSLCCPDGNGTPTIRLVGSSGSDCSGDTGPGCMPVCN